MKQAVSFDLALLLIVILPVHLVVVLGGERPMGQLRFWLRGAHPLPPNLESEVT